jgi:hypothetical protein
MATIKITITTPHPVDVEVTEHILTPDMENEQIISLVKEVGSSEAETLGSS